MADKTDFDKLAEAMKKKWPVVLTRGKKSNIKFFSTYQLHVTSESIACKLLEEEGTESVVIFTGNLWAKKELAAYQKKNRANK